jgi:hypothetical protein
MISYIEAYKQDISPNELIYSIAVDENIRINLTNFHNFLSWFGVDTSC